MSWRIRILTLVLLLLAGCEQGPQQAKPSPLSDHAPIADAENFARITVRLLAERRIDTVAQSVSPEHGLRFSPYGNITKEDVVLTADDLIEAWREDRVFLWGYYDGSGEPIEKSIQAYFDEFVYDADFKNAPRVAVNEIIGMGNTLVNLDQAYPGATFVEFHFPGMDPAYQGMDWRSLRLVMSSRDSGGWWLIGIAHDQWTI